MTEVPKSLTNIGLGARTFSKSTTGRGDTSAWTDTPADRIKKAMVGGLAAVSLLFFVKRQNKYSKPRDDVYSFLSDFIVPPLQ